MGLGLAYATPIISLLSYLMGTFTETEQEMVSVERMQQVYKVHHIIWSVPETNKTSAEHSFYYKNGPFLFLF